MMGKSVLYMIIFQTITNCVLCANICNNNVTAASKLWTNQETELAEAFARLLRFAPALFGNEVTEEDEKRFVEGSKQEDVCLEIDKLIPKYGYGLKKYDVITEDGYILTLFRIPSSGRAILLMHGLLGSADDWVTPGPNIGIAYLLAAEGYDVWMGNARGTKHSRRHLHLSPESADFWNFSWDEIGRYDLPAIIDYVLNETHQTQLLYVGHSQGTTNFFVMGSERPEYNNKISLMVALAPVAAVTNLKSPLYVFLKYASLNHAEIALDWLRKIGLHELSGREQVVANIIAEVICGKGELTRAICRNSVFLLSGFRYSQLNITNLPVMLSHMPAGASVKQAEHYAQTATFNRFQKFDYGLNKNILLYGSVTPPEYNLESITTPMALFYSAGDWLGTESDTLTLRKKLNNVVDFYKVPDEHFRHIDFLYAKDVRKFIFPRLLKLIQELNK